MENFHIKSSSYYPKIDFNAAKGILTISGELSSESTLNFFEPIFDWLKRYAVEIHRQIYIEAQMKKNRF